MKLFSAYQGPLGSIRLIGANLEGGEIFTFDQLSYGDQGNLLWAMCEQEKKNILRLCWDPPQIWSKYQIL